VPPIGPASVDPSMAGAGVGVPQIKAASKRPRVVCMLAPSEPAYNRR
jgi:hypothetical protein